MVLRHGKARSTPGAWDPTGRLEPRAVRSLEGRAGEAATDDGPGGKGLGGPEGCVVMSTAALRSWRRLEQSRERKAGLPNTGAPDGVRMHQSESTAKVTDHYRTLKANSSPNRVLNVVTILVRSIKS